MNTFLQENIFAIILFLLLIILLLIALIAIVIVKLLLTPKEEIKATPISAEPVILKALDTPISKYKKLSEERVTEKYYCENHPDIPSTGTCLICEDVFCESCLIEHEGLYFCKEHFKVFANNKWKQITDVRTTPNTPEDGLFIYHFKRHLWKDRKIPSFVLTHYKINLEEDFIESFIQLNVTESEAEVLTEDIEKFKAKH